MWQFWQYLSHLQSDFDGVKSKNCSVLSENNLTTAQLYTIYSSVANKDIMLKYTKVEVNLYFYFHEMHTFYQVFYN